MFEHTPDMAHHARFLTVLHLIFHARIRHRIGLRHGTIHGLQFLARLIHTIAKRIILHDPRIRIRGLILESVSHVREGIPDFPECFIRPTVKRVLIHHGLQPVRRRRIAALVVVEHAGTVLAFGQHFLNVA